jgi:hypothetical protein
MGSMSMKVSVKLYSRKRFYIARIKTINIKIKREKSAREREGESEIERREEKERK